jgi:hypothetical protein
MSRSVVVLLITVVACASETPVFEIEPPDGPAYELAVYFGDPAVPEQTAPAVFIDGTERAALRVEHLESLLPVVVELRHGDLIAASLSVDSSYAYRCGDEYRQSVIAFHHGDLRPGVGYGYRDRQATCVVEELWHDCIRLCPDDIANEGERCEAVVYSLSPLVTRLECGTSGPKLEGEACSLEARAGGLHDNCGRGLICLDGTCRRWTLTPWALETECTRVPGYPAEVRLCP